MLKKHVGYIKVDKEKQSDEFSNKNQKKEIEDYCKIKEYKLVDIIIDEEFLGKNAKDRKEFTKMMKYLENKDVDGVIIWKISNTIRNVSELITITKELENKGKKLISIEDNYDSSNNRTRLMETINTIVEDIEKDNFVYNSKKARDY
jgi:site-specific DNA recombinase